jgi:hypothetical protein
MVSGKASERKLMRIYCGRAKGGNHEVAAVYATGHGLIVRFQKAVFGVAGGKVRRTGGDHVEVTAIGDDELQQMPLDQIPDELTDHTYVWCEQCGRAQTGFQPLGMFRQAQTGLRAVKLTDDFTARRTWDQTAN